MSWQAWADALRRDPQQAVGDLLRGAADVGPFERAAPHEMLLAILPHWMLKYILGYYMKQQAKDWVIKLD